MATLDPDDNAGTAIDRMSYLTTCETCKAGPFARCRTRSGLVTRMHAKRTEDARNLYFLGLKHGRRLSKGGA